jgi:hypothetical protein
VTQHEILIPPLSDIDFLKAAVMACERHPADAMERAILEYAETHGVALSALTASWVLVRDYDFDAVGKHMSHVWQSRVDDMFLVAAKGAVEGILEHSRADQRAAARHWLRTNEWPGRDCACSLLQASRRTTWVPAEKPTNTT